MNVPLYSQYQPHPIPGSVLYLRTCGGLSYHVVVLYARKKVWGFCGRDEGCQRCQDMKSWFVSECWLGFTPAKSRELAEREELSTVHYLSSLSGDLLHHGHWMRRRRRRRWQCVSVAVCLFMSVCFNVLKGMFMFSCVWVCVVACCHMEPVLDCPESVCVCVCYGRNCAFSNNYFISRILYIDLIYSIKGQPF